MTVRLFIGGSILTAISSWAIWALIINYLDPQRAEGIGFSLFFLSLFLAVASTTALIGYILRRAIASEQLATYAVRSALRQGIMLGIFLDLLLILQLVRLYKWWLAVIAIILFITTELIFLSYGQTAKRTTYHTEK
jgi:hypothetical protein